jgi:hypothetical protein
MRKSLSSVLWIIAALAAAAPSVSLSGTAAEALEQGTATLSFRYRYESVDDDAFARDASASTLRTRLTFTSAQRSHFSGLLELSDVSTLGSARYDSTRNGRTQYPIVPDPTGTELSQAWLRYADVGHASFTVGRQTLIRDNERFVSAVGWRQNEQAFDAAAVSCTPLAGLQLDYAYVTRVQRVFGPEDGVPDEDFEADTHLLNARYTASPLATLSGYGYFVDFEDAPAVSNRTLGVRLTGKWALNDAQALVYAAELARQRDYGDNPSDYEADYALVELGFDLARFSALAGYERLGGDAAVAGRQFNTPLATPHKFQGWADKFATTPSAGIADLYLSLSARFGGATAMLVYHDFEADAGGAHYGDEWDFQLTRTFAGRHALTLKAASYAADELFADTTKLWFLYGSSFSLKR